MKIFQGQHDNEEVLMVFRRHPIAMRKGFYVLLIPFVLASLPLLIWPTRFWLLWVALGGFGMGLIGFSYFFMSWYYSVFIVTTQRLRQITQKGLFARNVSDTDLDRIQNLNVDVPGFNASIFGFGTIVIQTYVGNMVLDKLRHPEEMYDQLTDIVNRYGSKKEQPIGNNETAIE